MGMGRREVEGDWEKKTGRRNCEGEVKVEMKRDGGVGKKKR